MNLWYSNEFDEICKLRHHILSLIIVQNINHVFKEVFWKSRIFNKTKYWVAPTVRRHPFLVNISHLDQKYPYAANAWVPMVGWTFFDELSLWWSGSLMSTVFDEHPLSWACSLISILSDEHTLWWAYSLMSMRSDEHSLSWAYSFMRSLSHEHILWRASSNFQHWRSVSFKLRLLTRW